MRLPHYRGKVLRPVLSRGNNEFIHTRLQYTASSGQLICSPVDKLIRTGVGLVEDGVAVEGFGTVEKVAVG